MGNNKENAMIDNILLSLKGLAKSKTAYGNVAGVPLILALLQAFGVVLTPQITAITYILANFVFRWITKKALKDK